MSAPRPSVWFIIHLTLSVSSVCGASAGLEQPLTRGGAHPRSSARQLQGQTSKRTRTFPAVLTRLDHPLFLFGPFGQSVLFPSHRDNIKTAHICTRLVYCCPAARGVHGQSAGSRGLLDACRTRTCCVSGLSIPPWLVNNLH